MNIKELCQVVDLHQINDIDSHNEIQGVYIGDLLSFVMANGKEGALWLTVQRHVNVIAVAQLNDFSGIIFVEGVEPDEDTIQQASQLHIPLLNTSDDAYHLSQKLIQAGI